MDLIDRLSELASRILRQRDSVKTEEAVKTAFIMPFMQSLGYDIFDPTEVIPEHTADHGVKKGEKVDYAIRIDGKVVMLIECKQMDAKLEARHASQLFRYFTVTDAKFGVLTDGIRYLFYTDLETSNVMDDRPFFEFNVLDFTDGDVEQLKKFGRATFDVDAITSTASDMKFLKALQSEVRSELSKPSDELVRMLFSRVCSGARFTGQAKESFTVLTKKAIDATLKEIILQRLNAAAEHAEAPTSTEKSDVDVGHQDTSAPVEDKAVVTTAEEIGAYRIIQAIAAEVTDPENITMRDAQSYCAILYMNNNRRTIARLYFDRKRNRQIGIFMADGEVKNGIEKLTDLTRFRDQLLAAVRQHSSEE